MAAVPSEASWQMSGSAMRTRIRFNPNPPYKVALWVSEIDGSPYAFEPVELTYLDRLRQTVHVL